VYCYNVQTKVQGGILLTDCKPLISITPVLDLNSPKFKSSSANNSSFFSENIVIYKKGSFEKFNRFRHNGNFRGFSESQLVSGQLRKYIHKILHPQIKHRTGWYVQQFAKLEVSMLEGSNQDLILVDSDCFLVNPTWKLADQVVVRLIPHEARVWQEVTSDLLKLPKSFPADYSPVTESFYVFSNSVRNMMEEIVNNRNVSKNELVNNFIIKSVEAINSRVQTAILRNKIQGYSSYLDAFSEYDLLYKYYVSRNYKVKELGNHALRWYPKEQKVFYSVSSIPLHSVGIEG
jgi:hypothetical protein